MVARLVSYGHPRMNRRQFQRPRANTRQSLKQALDSWQHLLISWKAVLDLAKEVDNGDRVALADSKLDECREQIARIRTLLRTSESGA